MANEFGVETVYQNILFRSRLEARWAAFFDALGWQWTYEPFDLNGYIPDFVLHFCEPLIVEVKPAATLRELRRHGCKIDAAGWGGEALLVGACPRIPNPDPSRNSGMRSEPDFVGLMREAEDNNSLNYWVEAHLLDCGYCPGPGVFNRDPACGWWCRRCGEHGEGGSSPLGLDWMWATACNATRWTPVTT